MSTNAGNLLWSRRRISLPTGATQVDTGIKQSNQGLGASSSGEPPLGISGVIAPTDGELPASRLQIMPLAPTAGWAGITHGEPWVNTATGTTWVTFTNPAGAAQVINVLFWNPSTQQGPGLADTYVEPPA